MALPHPPPALETLLRTDPHWMARALASGDIVDDRRYLHWDALRHRTPPEGLNHEAWWAILRLRRTATQRRLPFSDRHGAHFVLGTPDAALELLHRIDTALGGRLEGLDPLATGEMRDRYLVSSLIEEAITSSQMEGASTTRQVASELLRSGREPRTRSERMIRNNYLAMDFIRHQTDAPLTPAMVTEVQRILTEGTLDDQRDAGRIQSAGEARVNVLDNLDGSLLHQPPDAAELPQRLRTLCDFANGTAPSPGYLHPIVRAVLLHFMLAYDHPFVDGNGRTARALFYWSMLRQGYRLAEFLSISRVIKKAQGQYKRAFLHTETDGNDATYFMLHQLRVIDRAITDLRTYLDTKRREVVAVTQHLRNDRQFNHRQRALLSHAMRHPGFVYTFESHRASHDVAFATARADLLQLAEFGLLDETAKIVRARAFRAPGDLSERLAAL